MYFDVDMFRVKTDVKTALKHKKSEKQLIDFIP